MVESSDHSASGPASTRPCWPRIDDERREHRRDREREPVPDEVVDAGDVRATMTGRMRNDALGAEDHAVGTEAAVARERAARDVLHRVGDERDHEADEQDLLAVEQALGERRRARKPTSVSRSATPARTAPAIAALRTTGPPPMLAGAAVGDRAADLLLERQEEARARRRTRGSRGR